MKVEWTDILIFVALGALACRAYDRVFKVKEFYILEDSNLTHHGSVVLPNIIDAGKLDSYTCDLRDLRYELDYRGVKFYHKRYKELVACRNFRVFSSCRAAELAFIKIDSNCTSLCEAGLADGLSVFTYRLWSVRARTESVARKKLGEASGYSSGQDCVLLLDTPDHVVHAQRQALKSSNA